jgi:hypothetical protein
LARVVPKSLSGRIRPLRFNNRHVGHREDEYVTENVAFLSLARRLGNPLAELPECIGAVEFFNLVRGLRRRGIRGYLSMPHAIVRAISFERRSSIPELDSEERLPKVA